MKNMEKTMISVGIAGVMFLLAITLNLRYLFIIGAFFDWLPVFLWMKKKGKVNKVALYSHIAITLIAYAFGVTWFVLGGIYSIPFIVLWWIAVILGTFI